MKLPSIFNVGNYVKIMWPIVIFNDILHDMKRSDNTNLNIIGSTEALTHSRYKSLGVKIEINVDTLIFDGDEIVYNIQDLIIKARKVIIRKRTKITFR